MNPLLPDLLIVEGEIILRGRPVATAILSLKAKRRRVDRFIETHTEIAKAAGVGYAYGTTMLHSPYNITPQWGMTYIWPQWGSGNA